MMMMMMMMIAVSTQESVGTVDLFAITINAVIKLQPKYKN